MPSLAWFPFRSLREKLSAAAIALLTTVIVLICLLLLTAWSASEVIAEGQATQERVRIYTQLQNAARDYQGASYQGVREPGEDTRLRVVETRTRLENLLAEAARLPARSRYDEQVGSRISEQGRTVVDHFRDAEQMVAQVDRAWQERGSRAAMHEVNRLTQPIFALKDTLNAEIRRGDGTLEAAAKDAQFLIRLSVFAAMTGLVLALVFSFVMQFLLRTRLRPGLERLERGAKAFGSGDLGHRIELAGEDELSQLADTFDLMAETVAEKQEALRQVQAGLERSVAQRTEDLEQANSRLAASDERRRAFMADVSHELRTPLTIIRGEAQVALRTADSRDFDPHETFERILDQTHDLSRMVDDLFLIARAEAGGLPLDRQPLDLRELCVCVACDFDTLAAEMGGSIAAADGPPVIANVDRDRMRRALAALIENALRHCQHGVRIELDVRSTAGKVALSVIDNGPGLDFANAQLLFERFRRGETREEGSGLGLSLVKALVEAHGGGVELKSGPGCGTMVAMHFPLDSVEQVAA